MSNNSDPSAQVHQEIVSFVIGKAPSATLFEHPASRTSEESMEARHKASGERVTGAKALLIKMMSVISLMRLLLSFCQVLISSTPRL